ncbi:MAG: phage holin family protein [Pirellulaceae bacterium]
MLPSATERFDASPSEYANGRGDGASVATLKELLGGIVGDIRTLLQQQMELLRVELRNDVEQTIKALIYMGVGVVLAGYGGLLALLAVAYGLHWAFTPAIQDSGLPLWGSLAIVGAVVLIAGAAAGYFGYQLMRSFNPLPDQTAAALVENFKCSLPDKNR